MASSYMAESARVGVGNDDAEAQSLPQPQRLAPPRPRPNPFAPTPQTDVRIRSRSRSRSHSFDPFVDSNLRTKRKFQQGQKVKFHCFEHGGILPIFEHGNVLLFEPVVNIYPYNSTVLPGDVVFCQPRDDGPCYVCILGDITVPPKVGDGSAAPALRVGDNSAASALRVGDLSLIHI